MEKLIRIGISACLLGEKVRYDGGHRLNPCLKETLGGFADWVPVCPEAECGLSVPREPMHLVGDPDLPRLMTMATGIDHTNRMLQWARAKLPALEEDGLRGFIFKSRSPSCGMRDVSIESASGTVKHTGAGLFARAFMGHFPSLPVEDEDGLQDPVTRENFTYRLWSSG
ncbi:MAG: DUF523 domain-containing protein [bacterium]